MSLLVAKSLKIFFDGGWRPDIAWLETAVVAKGVLHHRHRIGSGTSEQAEWLALLDALRVAEEIGAADIILLGDSLSVIERARAAPAGRGERPHPDLLAFRERRARFARLRLRHVPRTQNLAGIALARMRDGAAGPV